MVPPRYPTAVDQRVGVDVGSQLQSASLGSVLRVLNRIEVLITGSSSWQEKEKE